MRQSPSINLVRKPENFIDRFINWALTAGRLLVIVTELIALGAFLYRFSLDRELLDLRSKIKQEESIVTLLKDSEETYRNLHNRIFLASNFGKQGQDKVKIVKDVIDFAPPGLIFNNLSIQEEKLKVNANIPSVSTLSNFVKLLKNYKRIERVSIDKIENRPASAIITVTITATLLPEKAYEDIK